MKKKALYTMSLLLAVTLLAAACGGNGEGHPASEGNGGEGGSASADAVQLRFWGGVPPESGPQAVVDTWNAAHPDIQVEYIRFVNDESGNTKLDTALLSSNDVPDLYVTYSDANLNRRIDAGMSAPLDELAAGADFDIDAVVGKDNLNVKDDSIYYLPATKTYQTMLINMSALEAAGADVPRAWTWDEFAELARTLNQPGQYGAYFNPGWEPIAYDMSITADPVDVYYGEDGMSTFRSLPSFREGLELQKALIDEQVTYPFAEANMNKLQPQDELLNEKAAMVFTGTYLIRYIKDEQAYPNRDFQVAFAPVPQYEAGTNVNSGGMGDYIMINPKSENKEAAMAFLAWYLEEGNMELVAGGRVPSSKQADMGEVADLLIGDYAKYIDKESLTHLLAADVTFKQFTQTTAQSEIQKAFKEEAEKYFMDAQSIDETIDSLTQRADEAIAAAK
ncbi:extracellular solute-binding protein [Paenibacillus sp. IB182496]|uniref:Extracellular solute-binding protein n=1 Tax=Paenibacillus sabuli TaxID=2772509 RepID=A0A927BQT1_9BACL|nr:extracellular solute-binding protein [Paenibacillus sabuli]MBD2845036.1 extracellular solute-binding protein [Paenibacillus sabuli]